MTGLAEQPTTNVTILEIKESKIAEEFQALESPPGNSTTPLILASTIREDGRTSEGWEPVDVIPQQYTLSE